MFFVCQGGKTFSFEFRIVFKQRQNDVISLRELAVKGWIIFFFAQIGIHWCRVINKLYFSPKHLQSAEGRTGRWTWPCRYGLLFFYPVAKRNTLNIFSFCIKRHEICFAWSASIFGKLLFNWGGSDDDSEDVVQKLLKQKKPKKEVDCLKEVEELINSTKPKNMPSHSVVQLSEEEEEIETISSSPSIV